MRKPAAILIVFSLAVLALAALPAVGIAAKGGNGGSTSQGGKGGGGNKGGGGSSSSLGLVLLNSSDGLPHHGQDVTFDVSTTATDNPYVNVRCYQGSAFVYDAWAGFYTGAWFGQTFTLDSLYWDGGAADCVARLVAWSKNGNEQTLTSLDFHVEP